MIPNIKAALKRVLGSSADGKNALYKLHSYVDQAGVFDYEIYKRVQTEGNKRKIDRVWVQEDNIRFISEYLLKTFGTVEFGVCQGTRRGLEQAWFAKYASCEAIGTEISDTATAFPNTVQHDFHDLKQEWVGRCDFVYSNSLDHAYDPSKALTAWAKMLKPGGIVIIEHTSGHEPAQSGELDPFGAALTIMPYLVLEWGKGDFFVTEILNLPALPPEARYAKALIIRAKT